MDGVEQAMAIWSAPNSGPITPGFSEAAGSRRQLCKGKRQCRGLLFTCTAVTQRRDRRRCSAEGTFAGEDLAATSMTLADMFTV
jgi:hypothetical protein